MTSPPKRKGIVFQRQPPFFLVVETEMDRRVHLEMAVLTILASAALVASPEAPDAAAAVTAFVAGYAWNNWLMFPTAYDIGGDGQ